MLYDDVWGVFAGSSPHLAPERVKQRQDMFALPCKRLQNLMNAESFAVSQHDTQSVVYKNSLRSIAGLHAHLPLVSTAGREEVDRPAVEVPRLIPWEPVSASLSFSDRAQLQHNTKTTEYSASWQAWAAQVRASDRYQRS